MSLVGGIAFVVSLLALSFLTLRAWRNGRQKQRSCDWNEAESCLRRARCLAQSKIRENRKQTEALLNRIEFLNIRRGLSLSSIGTNPVELGFLRRQAETPPCPPRPAIVCLPDRDIMEIVPIAEDPFAVTEDCDDEPTEPNFLLPKLTVDIADGEDSDEPTGPHIIVLTTLALDRQPQRDEIAESLKRIPATDGEISDGVDAALANIVLPD